jgi:hypothetical protein
MLNIFIRTSVHLVLIVLLLLTNISICMSFENNSTHSLFFKKETLNAVSKEASWIALLGGKVKNNEATNKYVRTEDGKDFYLQDKPSHDWLTKEMELAFSFCATTLVEVCGLLINLICPLKKLISITVRTC